jgi:hypothetical protein
MKVIPGMDLKATETSSPLSKIIRMRRLLFYRSFSTNPADRLINSSMQSMKRRCLIPIRQIATMNRMAMVNL